MLSSFQLRRAMDSRLIPAVCGLVALLVLSGCNAEEARHGISGTVSWQGMPVAKGVITLYPKGAGDTVGCEIVDGRFKIEQESGGKAGSYRVEILAFRPTGKTDFDIDENMQVSIEEQYLPKQFNTDSTLEAEIATDGENVLSFDLKARN